MKGLTRQAQKFPWGPVLHAHIQALLVELHAENTALHLVQAGLATFRARRRDGNHNSISKPGETESLIPFSLDLVNEATQLRPQGYSREHALRWEPLPRCPYPSPTFPEDQARTGTPSMDQVA